MVFIVILPVICSFQSYRNNLTVLQFKSHESIKFNFHFTLQIMNNFRPVLLIAVLIAATGFFSNLDAQSRHSNTELGIILGEPTGLSLKLWQSNTTAIGGAVAWSFGRHESVHIHADYLKHKGLEVDRGSLALYYGLGARAILANRTRFGARIPVGLQYNIPSSRLSVFFEVAPIFELVPSTDFSVNGGIGIRYFL